MPSPEFWTAVATAGTNQIGNIISTAMANDANERMQHEQNKWNLEQWNRNNAYNSPAAQMQRFKAAGLNPDLMYQQGTPGLSSAPAQGSNPIPKQPFQMQLDPLMLAQLKNIEADTNLKNSDANQKDALTEGINYDNITKKAAAAYQEEWLDAWNSYDKKKKRQMFDNMLSTCYIQEENATCSTPMATSPARRSLHSPKSTKPASGTSSASWGAWVPWPSGKRRTSPRPTRFTSSFRATTCSETCSTRLSSTAIRNTSQIYPQNLDERTRHRR